MLVSFKIASIERRLVAKQNELNIHYEILDAPKVQQKIADVAAQFNCDKAKLRQEELTNKNSKKSTLAISTFMTSKRLSFTSSPRCDQKTPYILDH